MVNPKSWLTGSRPAKILSRSGVRLLAVMLVAVLLCTGAVCGDSAAAPTPPIAVYKDANAWWGDYTEEAVFQTMGFAPGAPDGYSTYPTADLQSGIPDGVKLALITSNSYGLLSTLSNVNSAPAQANLRHFVEQGGVLVMHLAKNDNYVNGSAVPPFVAPGDISVDEAENAYTTHIVPAAAMHPIVIGPDNTAGTADDITDAILAQPIEFQTHGSLVLPDGATPVLASATGLPVMAEYRAGQGILITTTYTIEWYDFWEADQRPQGRILPNELGYAVSLIRSEDTTPPTISGVPADLRVEATSPQGTIVNYSMPSARDYQERSVPVTALPSPGTLFPLGTTTVTFTSVDAQGHITTASFKVTVVDTRPPTMIGVPGDMQVEATSPQGAAVSFPSPTATDIVDGPLPVTCAPPSGSVFPLGTTTVACSAMDARGNKVTASFKVKVVDTTPPTLTATRSPAPNSRGWNNQSVTVTFSAVDRASGVASCSSPVTVSSEGTNQKATGSASDKAGNCATATVSGINIDRTPPTITALASPSELWPPNGQMTPVVVTGTIKDAFSGVDVNGTSFAVIDSYGQLRPAVKVVVLPDGRYTMTFLLEARRSGQDKDGRQYTLQIVGRDMAGNQATATVVIRVAHDQGQGK